jgi:hypothetical protein
MESLERTVGVHTIHSDPDKRLRGKFSSLGIVTTTARSN